MHSDFLIIVCVYSVHSEFLEVSSLFLELDPPLVPLCLLFQEVCAWVDRRRGWVPWTTLGGPGEDQGVHIREGEWQEWQEG